MTWGDTERFALRIDALSYEYGDAATIRLANTSSERVVTGNRHKYNLERYTESGWRKVRVSTTDDALPITDERITQEPGGGFEWEIELDEDGIVDASFYQEALAVCPDLQTGRYRFVYFGIPESAAVAVGFDLDQSA